MASLAQQRKIVPGRSGSWRASLAQQRKIVPEKKDGPIQYTADLPPLNEIIGVCYTVSLLASAWLPEKGCSICMLMNVNE